MQGSRRLGLLVAVVASIAVAPTAHAASANVAALQVALTAVGISPGPVDGISGPWTRGAVRRFQRRHGLRADGIAGPMTRRALGRRGGPALGSRPMRIGERGWDVAALQFLLRIRGFDPGGLDGGFGANTLAAVRRYQAAVGLAVDGVAGPATLGALRRRRVPPSTRSAPAGAPTGPVRFLRPIAGAFTDAFGWYTGRWHTGLDFPAAMGAPVRAAGVGTVAFAGWNSGGYGNLVVVRHRLGFESWYAHLSRIATSAGAPVTGGTVLGYVGSTGHSTGPHLHFEVRLYGTPIDPVPRLLAAVAAARSPDPGRRAPDRRLVCRPNADARPTRDTDPPFARLDRCP
ncbi:MAG TPA: peptidoglycan-binding protein [Capillimicrobium sp.]|nr:peptidoglycan-binding protein [Capillimicrobium sp.]